MPDQMKATIILLGILGLVGFLLTNPAKIIGLLIALMVYLINKETINRARHRKRTKNFQ